MNEKPKFNPEAENVERIPAPVTGESLLELFTSDQFKTLLGQAGFFTKKTGRESGFTVVRDFYNPDILAYSELSKGTTDHISHTGFDSFNNMLKEKYDPFILIRLHFHPEIPSQFYEYGSAPIVPSGADLYNLQAIGDLFTDDSGQTLLASTLGVICAVDQKGDSHLLILQRQPGKKLSRIQMKQLDKILEGATSQDEALKHLRKFGYKAELITISRKGEISQIHQLMIKWYAFQPLLIDSNEEGI